MSTPIPTSSVVVAGALGVQPDGVAAEVSGTCALCGLPISVGDLNAPLVLGSGFMDDLSMAGRGSKIVCGFCTPLLTADNLRKTGYGVFSISGVLPFRKWADIAEAISNPPEPPFVMVYATANNQHMAWRAPVSYSKELFYVRVGLRDLKIRKPVLGRALDTCQFLGKAMALKSRIGRILGLAAFPKKEMDEATMEALSIETGKAQAEECGDALAATGRGGHLLPTKREFMERYSSSCWRLADQPELLLDCLDRFEALLAICHPSSDAMKELRALRKDIVSPPTTTAKTLPNPFAVLAPDLKDALHGLLKPQALDPLFATVFAEELASIVALTAGEVWALKFLLTPGAGQATA